jgi:glycosyltransferase involved in cell wall biosynthesis
MIGGQLALLDRSIAAMRAGLRSWREQAQRSAGRPGPGPIFLFVDHTVGCEINTGLQRVTRQIGRGLLETGEAPTFVKWDHASSRIVLANRGDLARLANWGGPQPGAAEWSRYPAQGDEAPVLAEDGGWLLVPEVTHITEHPEPVTLPLILAAKRCGLKTAFLFYDAIPLRRESLREMAERHQAYMQQLLLADVVLPISEVSARDLVSFFRHSERAGPASMPWIEALPLSGESRLSPRATRADAPAAAGGRILSVGSITPHKNQLALVRAFERFCAGGRAQGWELLLVGNLHPDLSQELDAAMRRNGRIRRLGHVGDEELDRHYRDCSFTVFPSVLEGFGLPILESLWHAKPCLCADFGAMGEVARGGGCLTVDTRSVDRLAEGLERLALDGPLRQRLGEEAVRRVIPGWADYAHELCALLVRAADPIERLGTIYYCIDHTAAYPANTGIQRVVRGLARELMGLGLRLVPFRWDAAGRRACPATAEELAHLARWNGPPADGWAAWTEPSDWHRRGWVLLPELFNYLPPEIMADLVGYGAALGLRSAAVVYDAIPWKLRGQFPEAYPEPVAQRHHCYLEQLNRLNLVIPISEHTRTDVVDVLDATRLRTPALDERIRTCALPAEFAETQRVARPKAADGRAIRILCVGTVEPRKNHLALLRAYARIIGRTRRPVELVLVGGAPFPALEAEVAALGKTLPGFRWERDVDDRGLQALYAACDLTVYPSVEEGFGLPILESLWNARPCVCADFGSMAELARDGGCLAVDVRREEALAQAMQRLAEDDGLRAELARAAAQRTFRTWRDYARDVAAQLAAERWLPAPAPPLEPLAEAEFRRGFVNLAPRPLLSICISTYNRAPWLKLSLQNLARLLPAPLPEVELLVCDNCSTDETPAVAAPYLGRADFRYVRNRANVGMLGNLRVTSQQARGKYVWILGDDDLVKPGSVEKVLAAIRAHPGAALVYLNYAYTRQDDARQVRDLDRFLAESTPILAPEPDRHATVREICARSENFFTAIYCLVFRRDHAMLAYSQNTAGRPFSTLLTCIPTTYHVLHRMMDEPACWIGEPQLVVNMNVSWMKYAPLWVLERIPEVHDLAERLGADPAGVDRWRVNNIEGALHFFAQIYESDPESNASFLDPVRVVRRFKHLAEFQSRAGEFRALYEAAHRAGRAGAATPPERVFAAFEAS